MTIEGWRKLVLNAVRRHHAGDTELVDLLAQLLAEQDEAKQQLRELGYGCTGMPWRNVVNEIGESR